MIDPNVHLPRCVEALATFRRRLLAPLTLALGAACAASSGSGGAAGPAWGGDPAVVAVVAPMLAARAEALKGVDTIEASCQRTDRTVNGSTRSVDDGRLVARRSPPCVVLTVTSPRPRTVREDAKTRLVLDPLARGATRWTFAANSRGLLSVAALFLDLETFAQSFDIDSVSALPAEDSGATRVVLTPRPGATSLFERIELELVPDQAVPTLVTVVGRGGDQLEYRIRRPTLDPKWRDPASRFRVEVPADYELPSFEGQ